MRFSEALSTIKSGRSKRFALLGSESFLKNRIIRMVQAQVPETQVFYEDDTQEALSAVSAPSLYDQERALVLVNFDEMKPDRFVRAVASCEDLLVLSFDEKPNLGSRSVTEILGLCEQVSCEKMKEYGNEYPLWIASVISDAGFSTEGDVASLIYSRVGPNMYSIFNEIQKLFAVKTDNRTITLKDVGDFVPMSARASTYDILESLLKKDVKAALTRFNTFYKTSESPHEFTKFLGSYLEKLYRMLVLRELKYSADDIADIVGIPRFLVKTRYLGRALTFGKLNIVKKIDQLCDLEVSLRLFNGDKRVLMEKFIMSFA